MASEGGGPANAIGKGVDFVASQALSKAGATLGSALGPLGTGAGYVIGTVAGRFVKYAVAAVAGAVILVVLFVVVILSPLLKITGLSGTAYSLPSQVLKVTKTPEPLHIDKNGSPQVAYTITVTNAGLDPMTDIKVTDDKCSAINYTIPSLAAGETNTSQAFSCSVDNTTEDHYFTNTVTVTATIQPAVAESESEETSGDAQTITNTATAMVSIGTPPNMPPAHSPLRGNVYCSGYGFQGLTPSPCPYLKSGHNGVDLFSDDGNVYSPFMGPATVIEVDDDGDCTSCFGVHIQLQSGPFTVLMAHLERGSVPPGLAGTSVDTNTQLGVMDNTGYSFGNHVHYEMRSGGSLVNPLDRGALTLRP
jgi:hypothetical protein